MRRLVDLPEETWRDLKVHAATRGQTLGQLFMDMASETVGGREATRTPVSAAIDSRSTDAIRPGEPATGGNPFTEFHPAPKIVRPKRK